MKSLCTFLIFLATAHAFTMAGEHVILLHGLCRGKGSMKRMEKALDESGYTVTNLDYPSRSGSIRALSTESVGRAVQQCEENGAGKIHFVTHSMGGILVRDYLSRHRVKSLGRVVMLAPPNQGSEVVDKLGKISLFQWINGPAGRELGTHETAPPQALGPVNFPLGVIAGDLSINWINSLMIPGRDDGKVSIQRTRVRGMKDHVTVHTAHPFIMKNKAVISHTLHFLKNGTFSRE